MWDIRTKKYIILCSPLSNEDMIDIKCGSIHAVVLTSNGDVLSCWLNKYRQLGRETNDDHPLSFKKIEEISEIIRIECGGIHYVLTLIMIYMYLVLIVLDN